METDTEKKLKNIETELHNLKSIVIKFSRNKEPMKIVKIKGLLNGISIGEEDINESKNSIFVSGR